MYWVGQWQSNPKDCLNSEFGIIIQNNSFKFTLGVLEHEGVRCVSTEMRPRSDVFLCAT